MPCLLLLDDACSLLPRAAPFAPFPLSICRNKAVALAVPQGPILPSGHSSWGPGAAQCSISAPHMSKNWSCAGAAGPCTPPSTEGPQGQTRSPWELCELACVYAAAQLCLVFREQVSH